MRKDMSKVVTERPRHGGDEHTTMRRNRRNERQQVSSYVDEESDLPPSKCSMRRPYKLWGSAKSFSDLINPLERFLHTRVGKPWDAVYSEICENLKVQSVTQAHIRQHVKDMVDTHTYMKDDGLVYSHGRFWRREYEVEGFYVHPKTGKLCFEPRKRYNSPKSGNANVQRLNNRVYVYRGGVWFECVLGDIPDYGWHKDSFRTMIANEVTWAVRDVYLGEDVYLTRYRTRLGTRVSGHVKCEHAYGDGYKYCMCLVQLNSREIRKLKLHERRAKQLKDAA